MNRFEGIYQSILDGDEKQAAAQCRKLLDSGCSPVDILEKGMIPAMDRLGVLLSREERFIPQILLSASAMQGAVAIIRPLLLGEWKEMPVGSTIVVGTVRGDIHTIGKNLVGIMLQSAGFEVADLGSNVSTEAFIREVYARKAKVVALSAMLTTSMSTMKSTVRALKQEDFGYPLLVIVGGGPITPSFAREVHAEFASSMLETVRLALAHTARQKNTES